MLQFNFYIQVSSLTLKVLINCSAFFVGKFDIIFTRQVAWEIVYDVAAAAVNILSLEAVR